MVSHRLSQGRQEATWTGRRARPGGWSAGGKTTPALRCGMARVLALAALAGVLIMGAGCSSSRELQIRPPVATETSRLLRNAHYFKLMGRPEASLKEMEQAHRQDPDNLKIVDALAQNYQELGQFQRAQELYQEALTRQGSNRALRNNWCYSFYLQGNLSKAETCFKEALERDPGNTAARNNLGLVWCRQDRLAEAQRLWEEAEGAGGAQKRLQEALAFLGKSPPAQYAKGVEPKSEPVRRTAAPAKPAAPLAPASPPKPVVAEAKPGVKAPAPAQPMVAPPKAEARVAAKTAASKPAPPPLAAVPARPAAPLTLASPAKPLVSEAKPAVKGPATAQPEAVPSKAEVQVAAKPAAPNPTPQTLAPAKPAVPVTPAVQPKPVAAESKAPVTAPAQPAATPSKAEAQLVAKAGEPQPAPVKRTVTPQKPAAPAMPTAAAPKTEMKKVVKPAPPSPPLTVAEREAGIEVRNGTRTKDLAHLTRSLLSGEGFNVVQIGNHIDFGAEATVIYYRDGAQRLAQALNAEIFPEAKLEQSARLKDGVAVKVLLGQDLSNQPRLMARLTEETPVEAAPAVKAKAPETVPQPQATASKVPAASISGAAPAKAQPEKRSIQAPAAAARPVAPSQAAAETLAPKGPLTAQELMATTIEIRNGTRSQNLAHRARSLLSREGFNVGIIGNHIDFGAETTVIYYRPGAEKVARALSSEFFPGAQLTPNSKLNHGMTIKVLLGSDLLDKPQLMSRLTEEKP